MVKIIKTYWAFILGLAGGLLSISMPVLGYHFAWYPGDLIDARFCNYILEHAYLFLSGQLTDYWSAPFLFPEEKVITYSENFLGTAPFYAVFRLLQFNRETSFQAWYLLIVVLNYGASYMFLNKVFNNRFSAVLGAFVFTFSLALQSQMGHAQTMARFPIPLALLMCYLFVQEFKPVYFFGLVFFWVFQMYCGIYLGFMLVIPIFFFLLFSLFFYWKQYAGLVKNVNWLWKMLAGLLLNVGLLAPLMLPYMERAKGLQLYSYEHVAQSLLTPLSYLFSWRGSLFWDKLSALATHYPVYTNFQVFAGALATLAIISVFFVVIVKWIFKTKLSTFEWQKEKQVLFLCGVFTFICFTRFGDFSFYRYLFHLPGFASMRALQRIVNIELLFYALAVAFMYSGFFKEGKFRFQTYIFLLLVFFLCLESYVKPDFIHHHEKGESYQRVGRLIEKMKDFSLGSVISYEPDTVDSSINDFHLDAMLAAQTLQLKSINGYTSTSPDAYSAYWSNPNQQNRMIWLHKKGIENKPIYVIK